MIIHRDFKTKFSLSVTLDFSIDMLKRSVTSILALYCITEYNLRSLGKLCMIKLQLYILKYLGFCGSCDIAIE